MTTTLPVPGKPTNEDLGRMAAHVRDGKPLAFGLTLDSPLKLQPDTFIGWCRVTASKPVRLAPYAVTLAAGLIAGIGLRSRA